MYTVEDPMAVHVSIYGTSFTLFQLTRHNITYYNACIIHLRVFVIYNGLMALCTVYSFQFQVALCV